MEIEYDNNSSNNSNCVTWLLRNETILINNSTICLIEHAPTFSNSAFIRFIVLIIMAIFSLIGNFILIWNIYKKRLTCKFNRHNSSAIYHLILHLSISDILVTNFCMIGEAIWSITVEWIAGVILCKLIKYLQMFSLYLSTYILVLIGIDRWIAVKYPIKSLNTSKRCNRLLIIAYILSFLLSLPQSIIFRIVRGPFIEDFFQCHTQGFYSAHWQEQFYTTFTLIFMFIIPLIILISTYFSTFKTISGSAQVFNLETYCENSTRRKLIHKAKKKSLQISLVIVIAFIVCWTPYYVMMIIFMFLNPDKRFGEDLQSGIFFFGMSNSLINPIIYGAFQLWNRKTKFQRGSTRKDTGSTFFRENSKNIQIPLQKRLSKDKNMNHEMNTLINTNQK